MSELNKGLSWRAALGSYRSRSFEGAFADCVNLAGRHVNGDAYRRRQSLGITRLKLLQAFDHGLLVFGAQLAESTDNLARVTPISV